MNIIEHVAFATSIFEIDLPGISDKLNIKNSKHYKVGQTSGLQYYDEFNELTKIFKDKCKEISENYYNVKKNTYSYDIGTMWLNSSDKYAYHPPHNHCNTFLSGVLMLDGEEGQYPDLEFIRPNVIQVLPTIEEYNALNSNWFGTKTLKDKLYIFPSGLMHFVRINLNEKTRDTIAFDMILRGTYYEDVDGQGKNIGKFKI